MTPSDFNDVASGIQALVTCIAVVVGGVWTYKRFGVEREGIPRIEFTVDIRFVSQHGQYVVAELIANVSNKGKVRHEIRDFTFDLSYVDSADEIEIGRTSLGHELAYPHEAASGSWISPGFGYTFIEPGTAVKYTSSAVIAKTASVVLLAGRFVYPNVNEGHTAETIASLASWLKAQSATPGQPIAGGATTNSR
jgi:hypothetical protein